MRSRSAMAGILPVLVAFLMMGALALPALAEPRFILKGHTLPLGAVVYSPDGLHVATGSYDRTAKVWDATTGKELVTLTGGGSGTRRARRLQSRKREAVRGRRARRTVLARADGSAVGRVQGRARYKARAIINSERR